REPESTRHRERHTAARSAVARLESCGGAELTAAVIPPAIHGVVDRHTAGEVEPRADRAERQPARDGDGRRRGARRATAQLARAIVAPAVGSAVVGERAGVAEPGGECPKVQPARDRDRYWAPGDRSVPEPSARSAAPAVGGPARDHPAGEPTAAAHGGEGMVSLGQDG